MSNQKKNNFLTGNNSSRAELEGLMKRAADLIRTRVDYEFLLILLFLKTISDRWIVEYKKAYEEALANGLSPEEADKEARSAVYNDFVLTDECLWDNIRKDPTRLAENLSKALKIIAEKNPELKGVIDRADFIRFAESRENQEILRQIVELLSEKRLYDISPDILGDAYEWVLRYFAPEKAKEGEIYTPREVIRLLVEMLEPKPGEKVYDPCCGSGGMLILSYKYVESVYGKEKARELFLYGQEANHKIWAYCKMNLYIHNIRSADIQLGDTLLYPKHPLGFADVVLANPPWNQDGYHEEVLKKGDLWQKRFPYGFPPKESADWAWIQHMLAMAKNETGRIGVVIDYGCLFRKGKEREIRRKIIEADLIECVVLLPKKLFYNTDSPGAIIILRKNKPAKRKGKILFINASNEYIKHPTVRKLNTLSEENIRRIVEAYREFKDTPGFARVVTLEEVRRKDYDLDVKSYITPVEEDEQIDIVKEWSELKELEKQRLEALEKLEQYITEIAKALGGKKMKFYREMNFKNTEIGKIPNDWEVVRLGDFVELRNGKRPEIIGEGDIPIYGANGIMGYTTNFLVDNDFTLVIGRVGSPGEIHLTKGKAWISDNAIYVKNYERGKIYLPFVFYLLKFKKLKRFAVQTTHPLITQTFLDSLKIPLPPLKEQQRIAEILLIVDEALQKTNDMIEKTERLKKGFMKELLTKGIGHKELKDTEIGRISKDWRVIKLGSIITYIKGRKPKEMSQEYKEGYLPYLSAEYLRENRITGFVKPSQDDILVNDGDIILLWDGSNAGEFFLGKRGVLSSTMVKINQKIPLYDQRFLFYLLKSKENLLKNQTRGTGIPHVDKDVLNNIVIPLPPLKEQQKIAEILSTVDKKLELLKEEKERLERVKRGLMYLLLTGKVRVRVDD